MILLVGAARPALAEMQGVYGCSTHRTIHTMHQVMRRPKPKVGSLPMTEPKAPEPTAFPPRWTPPPWSTLPKKDSWSDARPPWLEDAVIQPSKEALPRADFKKLKAARRKVEVLADAVRSAAFDDWLRRNVVIAQRPDEWTRSRELYEGYVRHAGKYGNNRGDKRLATEELATETAWGKMMGSVFPTKKRRRRGWYYPVRLKKGA